MKDVQNFLVNVALGLHVAGVTHLHDGSHVFLQFSDAGERVLGIRGLEADVRVVKQRLVLLALLPSSWPDRDSGFVSRQVLRQRLALSGYENWFRDQWSESPDGGDKMLCAHELGHVHDVPAHVELLTVPRADLEEKGTVTKAVDSALKLSTLLRTIMVPVSVAELKSAWARLNSHPKGAELERLVQMLLGAVHGLVIERDIRIPGSQIDLLVTTGRTEDQFWAQLGYEIVVECKNTAEPVQAGDVALLVDRMRRRSARTGILVSLGGFTQGVRARVDECRRDGMVVITIDKSDLKDLCVSLRVTETIEKRYMQGVKATRRNPVRVTESSKAPVRRLALIGAAGAGGATLVRSKSRPGNT